jgi:hypothetical protein
VPPIDVECSAIAFTECENFRHTLDRMCWLASLCGISFALNQDDIHTIQQFQYAYEETHYESVYNDLVNATNVVS